MATERYTAFADTLKRHEKYSPTGDQLDQLRIVCELDYGIPHDAAYAAELFSVACDSLGADGGAGSVGYVHARYEGLVEFVRLVQQETPAPSPNLSHSSHSEGERGGR